MKVEKLHITAENNLIIGGGIESPEDFLKHQEKLGKLNVEEYLEGIRKLTLDINKLIEKNMNDYNVDIFIDSINASTKVRFNIDLNRYNNSL